MRPLCGQRTSFKYHSHPINEKLGGLLKGTQQGNSSGNRVRGWDEQVHSLAWLWMQKLKVSLAMPCNQGCDPEEAVLKMVSDLVLLVM